MQTGRGRWARQGLASIVMLTLGAVLAAVGVAGSSSPAAAAADQCQRFELGNPGQVRDKVEAATDVFEGRVVRTRERVRSGDVDYVQIVQVIIDYTGDLSRGDRVTVVTQPATEDGLGRLAPGERYLLFVSEQAGGNYVARRCGGTTELRGPLSSTLAAVVERVIENAASTEPTEPPAPEITEPEGGASSSPSLLRAVAPGIAVALVGALGLVVVIGLGSRRS
jgi:hypothetical protein